MNVSVRTKTAVAVTVLICGPFAAYHGCRNIDKPAPVETFEPEVSAHGCGCGGDCLCVKCDCNVDGKCSPACTCYVAPVVEPEKPAPPVWSVVPYWCPRCHAKTWAHWSGPEPPVVTCKNCAKNGVKQELRHPEPGDGASIVK